MIPITRADPITLKLLGMVPLPNLPNLQAGHTPNTNINDDQFITRFDHNFTAHDHFTTRYSFDEYNYNRLTSAFQHVGLRRKPLTPSETLSAIPCEGRDSGASTLEF